MQRPFIAATIVLFALTSFVGCGSASKGPTGTISGKLTLNGDAPPPATKIQFLSENGASAAEVSADGSFTLMGVPVGAYKVMVTPGLTASGTSELDPETAMRLSSGEGPEGKGKDPDAFQAATTKVPAKYTDIATSGVTFDVKEGTNDFALDMKE